jgi:hypothetical protein
MKRMILSLGFIIITLSFLLNNVNGQGPDFSTDPNSIEISVKRGGSVEKDFLFTNNGNSTLTGTLEEVNLECGIECPTLVILSDEDVELGPGGSMKVEFKIYSRFANKIQTVDLHIEFESAGGRETRIMEITINIQHNYVQYSICGGFLIVILGVIGYFVYKKMKKKGKEPT